eukprot:CAMPEP_0170477552 /NCGR_PEP_ID=MMETSP0123-20130129/18789_1 /TAXON_ID=182087 /ORGANISM="Favella ehrenbergii, Strain Fehren 1" /LENGTH=69 /DNA_ID=CAMNT_0010749349 /DNA_START=880 /DNA_END=1089 /DNA_ORIENTATION=+
MNMSALGLDTDRKLFLPEEINFPSQSMDFLSQPHSQAASGDVHDGSLLHQILRSSNQTSMRTRATMTEA